MLSRIPNNTFIRILFDDSANFFLKKISEQLQHNTGENFVSQLDPRAGLGCAPFHIKLISSVDQTDLTCEDVIEILRQTGEKFEAVHGNLLPVCTVNRLGWVSLKISCRDCVVIGRHLHQMLPGASDNCSRIEDNLAVNIGLFTGIHIAAFEEWLNKELLNNSAVFPFFRGCFIELSEECGGLTNGPIKLQGQPARKSLVRLLESDTPPPTPSVIRENEQQMDFLEAMERTTRNIVDDFKEDELDDHLNATETSTNSQIARPLTSGSEQTIQQRLLTSTLTHCKKITDLGLLIADVMSFPDFDLISPKDSEFLKKQCGKIFCMIDGLLKAVGPKVCHLQFRNMTYSMFCHLKLFLGYSTGVFDRLG